MRRLKLLGALVVLVLPSVAFANISELDIQSILINLATVINPALALLLSISFILGIVFVLRGLMALKAFALPLTQATRPGELSGPLISILVGAMMIYIPTTTNILTNTLFGGGLKSLFEGNSPAVKNLGKASDYIMGYATVTLESQWATLINTIVYYMEFIGFLAFLRGWILIAHAGQHHGQPGNISKGVIHIVGGILAINFLPLINAVSNTINGPS